MTTILLEALCHAKPYLPVAPLLSTSPHYFGGRFRQLSRDQEAGKAIFKKVFATPPHQNPSSSTIPFGHDAANLTTFFSSALGMIVQ
ncbi:MAG: hypothetical protein ABMA01_13495 [Chthoniobacteraceae bacterium]